MVKLRGGLLPSRGARKSGSRARKAAPPGPAPRPESPAAQAATPARPKKAAEPARARPRAKTPAAPVEAPKPAGRRGKAEPATPPSASPRRRVKVSPIALLEPSERVAVVELSEPARPVAPAIARSGDRAPAGRVMELHWGDDDSPRQARADGAVQRWVKRGDALLRHLAEHGASRHEYRADLKEGRFLWLSPEGRVSAEAEARVLCSYAPSTATLCMAWSDPLVKNAGRIARVEGMAAERDDVDEEGAWRVAMEAAERAGAEYLHRVTTPHLWYFLALGGLTFAPERESFTPGTPVGLVMRSLGETRVAIESRAEPSEVVRARLTGVGNALLHEAGYAYRGTDWVSRLERTGKWLLLLAERLPRASFGSLAAGRSAEEWLDREATVDLGQALVLLEDEWALFA